VPIAKTYAKYGIGFFGYLLNLFEFNYFNLNFSGAKTVFLAASGVVFLLYQTQQQSVTYCRLRLGAVL
jgi:hypothetical protein